MIFPSKQKKNKEQKNSLIVMNHKAIVILVKNKRNENKILKEGNPK